MAVVDESRYKSNSYRSRAEEENKKEVQKVVKGTVRKHEKTTGEKLKDSFFNELLYEVLIPSAKEILDTVIISTKDIILYGEVRDSGGRNRGGRGFIFLTMVIQGRIIEGKRIEN